MDAVADCINKGNLIQINGSASAERIIETDAQATKRGKIHTRTGEVLQRNSKPFPGRSSSDLSAGRSAGKCAVAVAPQNELEALAAFGAFHPELQVCR